jgi:hypothetical protein
MFFRFFLISAIIILNSIKTKGQQYEQAYCIGYEMGALGFMSKQNAPDMFSQYNSLTFAYFGDLRNGIRTGLDFATELDGAKNSFIIPVYYAYRSQPKVERRVVETFSDLLYAIFPSRFELNVGPCFGYFTKNNNNITNNEFRVRREMLFSINAGLRPSFQIWRFNLGVNLNVGYIPTKNFRYYSSNEYENGLTTNWMVHIGGSLTYSFNI